MQKENNIITFGCRLNEYESQVMQNSLKEFNITKGHVIINTCSVTQEAIKKSKKAILKAKKKNPASKIIVTGCAAQLQSKMFSQMPEVDLVLGNEEKLKIGSYLKNENKEKSVVSDIMQQSKAYSKNILPNFIARTRAFVQIQNGCNHRCTFCTIPFARGNNRSVEINQLVKQITQFVDSGYKEVVLTGVDITDYGSDINMNLAEAIKRILTIVPNLERLRLSSVDVAEIDTQLLKMIKQENRIMPHFHISLQSGDNMILKRMKRRHLREQVIDFCHSVRTSRKEAAFGADIIVGFPTETDAMYENTKNLINEAKLQYLHIFPYSPHENTPASRMPQVSQNIIKNRAKDLKEYGNKNMQQFFIENIGNTSNILVEKDNIGYSENFIKTRIVGNKQYTKGQVVPVVFTKYTQKECIMSAQPL